LLRAGLDALEISPPALLEVLPLRLLWRLVAVLGFAPELDTCARDGAPLGGAKTGWSFREGGALCASCAAGRAATALGSNDLFELRQLVNGEAELPALDDRHAAAHRRLLARWVREHLGEGAPLPALEFWQNRAWATA
jgi:recombinational DNA repair protein (RecF pathway)